MLKAEGYPQFSRCVGYGHYLELQCFGIAWSNVKIARTLEGVRERLSELTVAKIPGSTHCRGTYHLTLPSRYSSTLESQASAKTNSSHSCNLRSLPSLQDLCWLASFIVQLLLCLPELVQVSAVINICSKYVQLYCFVLASSSGYCRSLSTSYLQSPLFAIYARPMHIVKSLCLLLSGGRVCSGISAIPPCTWNQ